jgi:hypothetical protein
MHGMISIKFIPYSCQILMKLKPSRQISLNIKFDANPSIGSRFVACGQTDRRTDGQKDMTEVTVAFRNFACAPKTCTAKDKVILSNGQNNLQVLYTTTTATT